MEPQFHLRSKKDQEILRGISRDPLIENRLAMRARMILLRSEGKTQVEIGEFLDVQRDTVRLWEKRYQEDGVEGIYDHEGRGRKPSFSPS